MRPGSPVGWPSDGLRCFTSALAGEKANAINLSWLPPSHASRRLLGISCRKKHQRHYVYPMCVEEDRDLHAPTWVLKDTSFFSTSPQYVEIINMKYCYLNNNTSTPLMLQLNLKHNSSVHNYFTRQVKTIILPRHRLRSISSSLLERAASLEHTFR